jgi:NAD(P)-dependent dehydrogenase (short-subunit alcohol dehydrogenase family)
MAARLLAADGHGVVLHARNARRAEDTRASLPTAEAVVVGDLSSITAMREVAKQANALGRFDAVIHNAGIGYREPRRVETADGLSQLFAVNVLAPYVLAALIERPKRLVYLSSGMHHGVDANLDDLNWTARPWQGSAAYAESKLLDVLLAFGIARRWKDVLSNALEVTPVSVKPYRPATYSSRPPNIEPFARNSWLAQCDLVRSQTSPGSGAPLTLGSPITSSFEVE